MFFVVAYDIEDDKRRTKIHKLLKNYGQWMQFSLFECNLTQEEFIKLEYRLEKLIDPERDSIRYYFLCEKCQSKVVRIGGIEVRNEDVFIF
ncbi:MAG: CRISPR-associated endonuclease Cas2 [Firmicutes bacterium]|jgi:CRISPR-associated protein Cas2|nr:CRISPR-associated endonuclease Cas2 [Bacillota bacterium]